MKLSMFVVTVLLSICVLFLGLSYGQLDSRIKFLTVQEQDRPLKISSKPKPSSGGCSSSTAMARLKVTFDKSGKVTNVDVARPSGCSAFDRNAVKAAKKIKFEPAIKNGEAITMVKQVEYVYTRY